MHLFQARTIPPGLRSGKAARAFIAKDVLLTHENPSAHWTYGHGMLVLNLESLLAEYEAAFLAFYEKLKTDAALRLSVLPHVDALITPVLVQMPNTGAALSASATNSGTTLAGLLPRDFAALASPTAPEGRPLFRQDEDPPKKPPPK